MSEFDFDFDDYTATCQLCGHTEKWTTNAAAGCAMSWHVYQLHNGQWQQLFGNRPPNDPQPETRGKRVL